MTPGDIAELTATLTGAGLKWTDVRWTDASPPIWEKYLAPLDSGTAWEALGLIVGHEDEFPTIAQFRDCYQRTAHRRRMEVPALPESTAPESTVEGRIAGLARARDALAGSEPWFLDDRGRRVAIEGRAADGLARQSLGSTILGPREPEATSAEPPAPDAVEVD